jgi:trigger factor
VTVKAIKKKTLPKLDDAFANSVVKGKTLADLRAMARDELEQQKRSGIETEKRNQVMKQLLSKVECELPTNLVRQETQRILADIVRENEARGVTADVLKESEKELVGAAAQNAREKLKGTFVLLRIAEKEGIKVTKEELYGRIAAMAQKYGMTFEKMFKELEKRNAVSQMHEEFLTGKALEFLVANAQVS